MGSKLEHLTKKISAHFSAEMIETFYSSEEYIFGVSRDSIENY